MSAERDWLLSTAGGSVREFYASIGVDLPAVAGDEAPVRCFANPAAHKRDDRNASCGVNLLSGLWCCHGCGEKGNAYAAAVARGYPESRARELAQQHGLFLEAVKDDTPKSRLPNERQIMRWKEALRSSPVLTARLWELKGWTAMAIQRCGLGWDGERITFTVRDKRLKRVGVARYLPGGKPKMVSMPGSKRLLFPAPELMHRQSPLFVVEGEPAAVSVRSLGLQAVAVPGAQSWRSEFGQRLMPFSCVVLPDCDGPGREMAARVARVLPRVRVVDLDPALSDGSDIGDWIAAAKSEGGLRQVRRLLERLA